MSVMTREARKAWVDAVRMIDSTHPRLQIMLFTNSTFNADTVFADLNACAFSGYAPLTPNFSVPAINGADEGESVSDVLTWTRSAGSTSDSAYGWAAFGVDEGGANRIYGGGLFDEGPYNMTIPGTQIVKVFYLRDRPYP